MCNGRKLEVYAKLLASYFAFTSKIWLKGKQERNVLVSHCKNLKRVNDIVNETSESTPRSTEPL